MTQTKWGKKAMYLAAPAILIIASGANAAAPKADQEPAWNPAAVVNFYATITSIGEVPVGKPLAGTHLEAKAKGGFVDLYLAPTSFLKKMDITFTVGKEIHVIGSQVNVNGSDVVLVREVTVGKMIPGPRGGFREEISFYMRNDEGPFWTDEAPRARQADLAH